MAVSRLIDDLRQIPNIVGGLGLAIAEAQKHFDENYLRGLETLAIVAKAFMGEGVNAGVSLDFMKHLVETAAPTRYQFTETSLQVKLDLSESKDFAASGSLGFAFAGVAVNAAYSYGFSQDYKAAAEIRTVLHAVLPQNNKLAFDALLGSAKQLADKPLQLPERSVLDVQVVDAMKKVAERMGAAPAKIDPPAGTPAK